MTSCSSRFLTGFPFTVAIITLPQRFQIVNDLSPVDAGVDVVPMLVMTGIGVAITGAICTKKNISFCLLAISNIFQIIGTSVLSVLPTTGNLPGWAYGVEAVLGVAFGTGLVSLMIITRIEASHEDNGMHGQLTPLCRDFTCLPSAHLPQTILIKHP